MHVLDGTWVRGVAVTASQTFYPERERDGDDHPRAPLGFPWGGDRRREPRIHAPRTNALPQETAEADEPSRWPRAIALTVALSAIGGAFYIALSILVGEEVLAASLVIGVLAGAGMRLGGLDDRWSVAWLASLIGLIAWAVSAAISHALVSALSPSRSVGGALESALGSPAAVLDVHPNPFVIVPVATVLIVSGAVVAAASFTRRRPVVERL